MRLSLLSPIDRWRAPAPDPERADWIGQSLFAHRGLHGPGVPENSPAAFDLALRAGIGIECDIQRSGDGQAVVFHDWELDRLTAETGEVSGRTLDQLEQICLSGSDSQDRIPSLVAMLNQVAGQGPLLIEIKSRKERKVSPICLAVKHALDGYRGRHAVMSFDPRVSRWFAQHSPLTVRGLVVTEEHGGGLTGRWKRHKALWLARPDFLAYDVRDLPSSFAASQRKRGFPVATWTVRSPAQMETATRYADAPIAEGEGLT